MIWYHVSGIVVVILAFLIVLVKNLKWKKIIEQTKLIVEDVHKALDDGKISKQEFLSILTEALKRIL